jgi:hypothetical protein
MYIEFDESFTQAVETLYPIFRTPNAWPTLYGSFGAIEDRGGGWYAVPLKRFPFPLVARITADEPLRRVAWEFGGFWKGEGEVSFSVSPAGTRITGFERIAVRPLGVLSPLVERLLLEARFRAVWASGWKRLRRQAASG